VDDREALKETTLIEIVGKQAMKMRSGSNRFEVAFSGKHWYYLW